MATKQLIIARNYQQAAAFADYRGLRLQDWQCVEGVEDLRAARRGSTVWVVGTAWARKDYDELIELCERNDVGLVSVS